MRIPKPIKVVITVTSVIAGAFVLGHTTVMGSRTITLDELKFGRTTEEAAQLTEKDLVIDGQPIQILKRTHYFSVLWMLAGGCLGAAIALGGMKIVEKRETKGSNKTRISSDSESARGRD
jgi:hypothetical protein